MLPYITIRYTQARAKAKEVTRQDGPCGICGGQSGTDTGLSLSNYFGFHLSVSFHRSSMLNNLSPTLYNITIRQSR